MAVSISMRVKTNFAQNSNLNETIIESLKTKEVGFLLLIFVCHFVIYEKQY